MWQSTEQLKGRGAWYTDEISDSGDGYVKDFPLTMTSEQFLIELNKMIGVGKVQSEDNFLNTQVSLIVLTFNTYEPSEDRFISTQVSIQFSMAGLLIPHRLKVICFNLNIDRDSR